MGYGTSLLLAALTEPALKHPALGCSVFCLLSASVRSRPNSLAYSIGRLRILRAISRSNCSISCHSSTRSTSSLLVSFRDSIIRIWTLLSMSKISAARSLGFIAKITNANYSQIEGPARAVRRSAYANPARRLA
jgi:hypothetical protein